MNSLENIARIELDDVLMGINFMNSAIDRAFARAGFVGLAAHGEAAGEGGRGKSPEQGPAQTTNRNSKLGLSAGPENSAGRRFAPFVVSQPEPGCGVALAAGHSSENGGDE